MPPSTPHPLTTSSIPPPFLKPAYLIGHTPLTVLPSDPRISYTLYIPPHHYNAKGKQQIPLLVSIHGTARNLSPLYTDLASFADTHACAVLTPLFPAGLEGPTDLHSYKKLKTSMLRSDLAVLEILDIVNERWPGIATEKVVMVGFSGGGQFAHRFLFLYPQRLAAVSVGAPGSVTLLDGEVKWPGGISDVEEVFGRGLDVEQVREVAVQLIVGSEDVEVHGGEEFWEWVREMEAKGGGERGSLTRGVRKGRREHLLELRESLENSGTSVEFETVEGVAHDSAAVRPRVLDFAKTHLQLLAG